jgi:hypothetical protein
MDPGEWKKIMVIHGHIQIEILRLGRLLVGTIFPCSRMIWPDFLHQKNKVIPAGYRSTVAVTGCLITFFSRFSQFFSPSSIVAAHTAVPPEVSHVIMHQVRENGLAGIPHHIRQTIDSVTSNNSNVPLSPSILSPAVSVPPHGQPSAEQMLELGQKLMDHSPGHSYWYYFGWGLVIAASLATGGYVGYQAYLYYLWFKANIFPFLFALGMVGNFNPDMPGASALLTGLVTLGLLSKSDSPIDLSSTIPLPASANNGPAPVELVDLLGLEELENEVPLLKHRSGPVQPNNNNTNADLIDLSEFLAPEAIVVTVQPPVLEQTDLTASGLNEVAEGFRALLLTGL